MRDRPAYRRMLASVGDFFRKKPLGGFGVVIIAMVAFAAFAAPLIDRYDPGQSHSVPKPECTAEQAAEIQVAVTGQVTT